jgi:hypothetical protein
MFSLLIIKIGLWIDETPIHYAITKHKQSLEKKTRSIIAKTANT